MNILYTALLTILIFVSNSHANEAGAQNFINKLISSTMNILQKDEADCRDDKLVKLFESNVDIKWMAKFALGRHRTIISAEDYPRYEHAYKDYLIATYLPNFRKYNNEKVDIINVKNTDSANEYIVGTKIQRKNAEPIEVGYAVREINSKYVVFDIIAEGVSLISAQRSDFDSILSGNSNIDTLIRNMQSKTN